VVGPTSWKLYLFQVSFIVKSLPTSGSQELELAAGRHDLREGLRRRSSARPAGGAASSEAPVTPPARVARGGPPLRGRRRSFGRPVGLRGSLMTSTSWPPARPPVELWSPGRRARPAEDLGLEVGGAASWRTADLLEDLNLAVGGAAHGRGWLVT
jgi:hypothetical protein